MSLRSKKGREAQWINLTYSGNQIKSHTINYQGSSTRPGSSSDWLFFSLKGSCQGETKVNTEAEQKAMKLQGEHILIIKSQEYIHFCMYTKITDIQVCLERAARRFLRSLPEQTKKHHSFRLSNSNRLTSHHSCDYVAKTTVLQERNIHIIPRLLVTRQGSRCAKLRGKNIF